MAGTLAVAAILWCAYRLLFAGSGFDWRLFAASAGRLRWGWLAASLLPVAATYYGRALRWAVFLKPLKPKPSFRNLLSATLIGFSAITLFGRAGEFIRPYLIAVKENVPVPSQMAAWVLERLFDTLMALLLFAFALSRVAGHSQSGTRLAWVVTFGGRISVGLAATALVLLVFLRHFAEPFQRRLLELLHFLPEKQFARVERLATSFVQGVEATRSDGALLLVLLYSVLEWFFILVGYWCLVQAFGGMIYLGLADVLVFVGFVSFGSTVQIPGVGGGFQVVAVLVLTELFHVRLEAATFFALVIWIITFVVVAPVGIGVALKEGIGWRGLRRMSRGETV